MANSKKWFINSIKSSRKSAYSRVFKSKIKINWIWRTDKGVECDGSIVQIFLKKKLKIIYKFLKSVNFF